jgi:hypothetical protein
MMVLGIVVCRSEVDGGHRLVVELGVCSQWSKDMGAAPKKVEMLICRWLACPEFMQCVVALATCGELVVDVSGGPKGLVPHGAW